MTDAKRSKPKGWSFSTGERGRNRVRAFAHPKTGTLYLEFSERTRTGRRPTVKRVALGHRDTERAKAQAEELAAALRRAEPPRPEPVTLGTLFDIYLREVTPTKAPSTQRHDRTAAALFLRAFGGDREARTLSRREWDHYIRERRSGRLAPPAAGHRTGTGTPAEPARESSARRPVRNRIIAQDLTWLRAVLNWATVASDGTGGVLLDRNPLKGLPLPREDSPVRPRLDEASYRVLLAHALDVDPRFALALVLAHETGHRIGAIRMLRWSDIDLEHQTVRWRAENDKIGFEHVTPLTPEAVAALEAARARQRAIGDAWVFPAPGDPHRPCSRHLFQDWWTRGETLAGLPREQRRGWHALRRAFATELKHIPLKDLCTLGGWKAPQTVLTCYVQPDAETMRQALARRQPIATAGTR